jgi:hypothetical protein
LALTHSPANSAYSCPHMPTFKRLFYHLKKLVLKHLIKIWSLVVLLSIQLKLTGILALSWLWITAPIWLTILFVSILYLIVRIQRARRIRKALRNH